MADLWKVAALAEAVTAVAFGYLAILIGRNLARGSQWRHNALGLATFCFFLAGTVSRLLYAAHVMPLGWESAAVTAAARTRMADPLHVAASVMTAAAAAWFFGQRHALRPLHSLWLWGELQQRRSDAARLQKGVLERLQDARSRLAQNDDEAARADIATALQSAREIISQTLQTPRRRHPGDLRIAGRTP